MLKILCYCIAVYGFANMVCNAEGPFKIFEWWRDFTDTVSHGLGKLFSCMMCFSTWIGIAFSVIDLLFKDFAFTPFWLLLGGTAPWWLIIILDCVFASGIVWLIHNFEEACERHGGYEFVDEDTKGGES